MELVFLKGFKPAAEELELFNPYQGQLPWDKAAGHDVKHRPHLEPTLIMSKGLPPLHHTPSYCDAYLNPGKTPLHTLFTSVNVVRRPVEVI